MGKIITIEELKNNNPYGELDILRDIGKDKHNHRLLECLCSCGNICEFRIDEIRNGSATKCYECRNNKYKRMPIDKYIGKIYGDWEIIEYYDTTKNRGKRVKARCIKCEEISIVYLDNLKRKRSTKCKKCAAIKKASPGEKYKMVTVVKDSGIRRQNGSVVWECICDCGKTCFIDSTGLGRIESCGCKIESKGEEKIRVILETLGVKFEQYYKGFKDMRDKGVLECDFWLPGFNRVIEFDGELHYQEKENFGDGLENVQRRDQIKNQYCWDHGIDIVRIPYWELDNFTMEDLVSSRSRFLVRKEG